MATDVGFVAPWVTWSRLCHFFIPPLEEEGLHYPRHPPREGKKRERKHPGGKGNSIPFQLEGSSRIEPWTIGLRPYGASSLHGTPRGTKRASRAHAGRYGRLTLAGVTWTRWWKCRRARREAASWPAQPYQARARTDSSSGRAGCIACSGFLPPRPRAASTPAPRPWPSFLKLMRHGSIQTGVVCMHAFLYNLCVAGVDLSD